MSELLKILESRLGEIIKIETNITEDRVHEEVNESKILSNSSKQDISEYMKDDRKIPIKVLNVNFPEFFAKVWYKIHSNENREELLKILDSEIQDMKGNSILSRFFRLVNVFSGFD